MRIGLQIPSFTWPGGGAEIGPRLAQIAQMADEGGFASLWVMDHFFQMEMLGPVAQPMLESASTLSYLAGLARQVRLGALVTGAFYRPPALMVKSISTLDVLSGGRAYFGIGAGWYEREARGLGFPFPTMKERFERLEETLQIAIHLWRGDSSPYQGKYTSLAEPINSPQPLSTVPGSPFSFPHPPILIGGMGEKKTLPLVARFGDACNLMAHIGSEALRSKLDLLKRYCDEFGRDYTTIERTALTGVDFRTGGSTPAEFIARCREVAGAGIQHLIVNLPNVEELQPLETLAREVIPAAAEF